MINLKLVVEALDDINVFLREGKNNAASGQLRISERDINDQIFLSLEVPQSNIRDGSELQENGSIYLPIDFKLRNTENNELVWEYDHGGRESQTRI